MRIPRSRRGGLTVALLVVAVCLAAAVAPAIAPTARAASAANQTGRALPRARTSATAVPKMIWGPVTLPSGASAFPIYHQLGVGVYEIDLTWADVAPTRPADPTDPTDPAYQWPAELSTVMAQARRYHIEVCLLVQDTPGWANGGRGVTWTPTHPSDYANFLIAASRKYPAVRHWMIWGEPNRDGNYEPMPVNSKVGPRSYARLLNAAYGALKSVSQANIVIGGDTWSFGTVEPADFVRWMRLPDGKPPRLDFYGHNPFSRRFPKRNQEPYFPGGRDIDDLATLESQLTSTYGRPVDEWLSEFTISTGHGNRAFSFAVSPAEQAKWVTAAYKLVNTYSFVAGLGWFDLADQSPPGPTALTTGLMTSTFQPKPSFYAYEHAR